MCHPCYNAQRALRAVVKGDKAQTKLLDQMSVQSPEIWKARVRACRIIDLSLDEPGVAGVGSASARRIKVAEVIESITQTIGIQQVGGLRWLTQSEYLEWAMQSGEV